jgi:hypothetical protein
MRMVLSLPKANVFELVYLFVMHADMDILGSVHDLPAVFIVIVITFMAFWGLSGLACYHSSLVSSAMTTHEAIRNRMDDKNPFDKGSLVDNALCMTL